jgi:hypothetical protein
MEHKGFVSAFGHTKKEKKDETVYTYNLKVANKDGMKLEVHSNDKAAIDEIKKNGTFEINPSNVNARVIVELSLKKEKFDKEFENILPGTGDPWLKMTKTIEHSGKIVDTIDQVLEILEDETLVKFV